MTELDETTSALTITGELGGDIGVDGVVRIAEGASFTGSVRGRGIVVNGVLKGSAIATETIHVSRTARVEGDLEAPHVHVADGAEFHGQLRLVSLMGFEAPDMSDDANVDDSVAAEPEPLEPVNTPEVEEVAAAPAETPAKHAFDAPPPTTSMRTVRAARRAPPMVMPRLGRVASRRRDIG